MSTVCHCILHLSFCLHSTFCCNAHSKARTSGGGNYFSLPHKARVLSKCTGRVLHRIRFTSWPQAVPNLNVMQVYPRYAADPCRRSAARGSAAPHPALIRTLACRLQRLSGTERRCTCSLGLILTPSRST